MKTAIVLLISGLFTVRQDAFTLDSKTFKGGDTITLKFPAALKPDEGTQYWCCVVPAGSSDSSFGTWAYVEKDATTATLKAPAASGEYEVRLHSDYPKKSYNVVHRVKITVGGLEPTKPEDMKFTVDASAPVDKRIKVKFPKPMVAVQGEYFWVALVEAGSPDDERGLTVTLGVGVTEVDLPAATASGKHEVRLHANYPKKNVNIVHRAPLEVTGGPETAPTDPSKVVATMEKASIGFGEVPTVKFNVPLRPRTGERFWMSILAAGLPEASYGLTAYPDPGAKSWNLPKPVSTGEHEIRIYANYPKKSMNLIARLKLDVTGGAEYAPTDPAKIKMSAASDKLKVGEVPKVSFDPAPRARTGEQYWATIIESGKPDTEWGKFRYIEHGSNSQELEAPKAAGKYEIRLHANYPTKSTNVVQRLTVTVE